MTAANACPACGSDETTETYSVPDHEYSTPYVANYRCCATCGSLYQAPMPSPERLRSYYPGGYHSFGKRGALSVLRHRIRLNRLRPLLTKKDATILDYGCGDGSFATFAAAAHSNLTVWGFEVGFPPSVTTAEDGRVVMVRGTLEDLLSRMPRCDLITMNHVIEHLPDPGHVLSRLNSHMQKGAVLDGQTPAADSLERRVFGTLWSGFHAPRHTVVFSRTGLRRLLRSSGFPEPRIDGGFNPAGIAVSLGSMRHGNGPGVIRRSGVGWLALVGIATAAAPVDLLSGAPGILNFRARTPL